VSLETPSDHVTRASTERGSLDLRQKVGVYLLSAALLIGMACWVLPRAVAWPPNDALIALWLVSTAMIAVAVVATAWLFVAMAPRSRTPWVMQVVGLLLALWIILFVAFNLGPGDDLNPIIHFSKTAIVVPQLLVTAAIALLVVVRWPDVCDKRIWASTTSIAAAELRQESREADPGS
jgi:energy-coupling factor transporter transmembrane protein EcfT